MTSQDSDLLAEKATNRHAFPQKRPAESLPAIAGTSSQDSASSLRKKIKRTNNDDSSKAQQAQSKTAYSKRACIDTDRKKLKINGRIISLGPKEIVFVKLLFEKINTYVSINDLYVAVYGGKAGGWKKDSRKEKRCFYSLIFSLRKKLPEDCFKSNPSTGYMLSDPVMTSQSSPSAREEIKRTPVQDKMVYSSGIGMNIEKKKLEIDGESFVFGSQEFMALKLLFEKINTYVSTNDLCVAVYGGKAGDWKKDSKEEKRLYKLFYLLGHRIPENYIKGNLTMGYMLSNSNDLVDVSYQGFEASPKKIKGTDDADSSKVSESEEDGGNLQKIQYDREKYPLIGECYLDDYDQFIKDTESIRSRYINVQKSPGFVRIGEVYISFKKNKVTIDGRDVVFRPREVQSLRFLALWYPDVVSYEQIYYNLSFRTKEDYVCYYEDPKMRKHYLFRLISCVRSSLKSATERDRINFSKGKGYSLVCCSNRQASPNESSVQDTIHSQSTDSSS
jgi:DNA-binding winged helix-turn-helix (wHTH) protein